MNSSYYSHSKVMQSNGFNVYKIYLGIKLHFKSIDYEYSIYGPINAKYDTYENRRDKYWFERLANKYKISEIEDFFISNFLYNDELWSKELVTDDCEVTYLEWQKRTQGVRHTFSIDCYNIRNYLDSKNMGFNDLFKVKDGNLPPICTLLLQGHITPETYCIFDILTNFVEIIKGQLKENIVWSSKMMRFNKYKYLMSHTSEDITHFRKTVLDIIRR